METLDCWLTESGVKPHASAWSIAAVDAGDFGVVCRTDAFEKTASITGQSGESESSGEQEQFHLWMRVPRALIIAESDARQSVLGRVLVPRLRQLTGAQESADKGAHFTEI